MADPRMKELAYQALLMEFQNPLIGFEGIEPQRPPDIPNPQQRFTAAVPTISPFEPTMRQRLGAGAQRGLEFFGMRRPQARSVSQAIFGGPSSPLPADLGIADVVPFLGTALQTEEAAGSLKRAGQLAGQGEYGQAALEAGAGALGLVPGAAGTVQAVRPIARQMRETPPVGAITPIQMAREMAPKSPIGFYSAVEETVINLPQAKGTGDQFLAQIQKTPGVKPEEIQWTGLDEFLKGKKSVTKAEVQEYLTRNRVDVQEVRLGGELPVGWNVQQNPRTGLFDAIDPQGNVMGVGQNRAEAIADASAEIVSSGMPTLAPTKFSSYTLPGGENYREILLTLPTSGSGGKRVRVYTQDGTSAVQVMSDADIQRMAESGRRRFEVLDEVSPQGTFQSSHFDQPNILAHMRVNDRVVDGKKTLFIEEIQSDWHQAGRKRGYKSEALGEKVSDEEYRRAAALQRRRDILGETLTAEESADFNDIMARHIRSVPAAQVPDAPFKTSWHELSLKRAIQEASEKGYDKIAFTTGRTQAERYDLSKQVDRIAITKTGGVWAVNAWKGGTKAITKDATTDSDLANLVGKELADKAIKQGGGEYAGLDLQVGGEGMKGFYDNILPKSLEKLGKKFDAKVGKTEMDGVEVWQMDITPKMRESAKTKGQPLFQVLPPVIGVGAMQGEEEVQ